MFKLPSSDDAVVSFAVTYTVYVYVLKSLLSIHNDVGRKHFNTKQKEVPWDMLQYLLQPEEQCTRSCQNNLLGYPVKEFGV